MELADIRVEIDKIDDELKTLYFKRMELSKEVAKIKSGKETGKKDNVYKPDREKQILLHDSAFSWKLSFQAMYFQTLMP